MVLDDVSDLAMSIYRVNKGSYAILFLLTMSFGYSTLIDMEKHLPKSSNEHFDHAVVAEAIGATALKAETVVYERDDEDQSQIGLTTLEDIRANYYDERLSASPRSRCIA